MSKIAQIRKRVADCYYASDLENAARHGEALLREHIHNQTTLTRGYADDLYNLARVYDEWGVLERAMQLYTDGAHLYTKLADGDPSGYSRCLNNLAAVLHEMGHEESSAHLFWQLAAVQKHNGNDTDASFADGLYNLANASSEKNYKQFAQGWHNDALKIRQQCGNVDDIIDSLHSLAFMHEEKREYEKAIPLAEMAMTLATEDDYAGAVFYVAQLKHLCGQDDSALHLYMQAMEEIDKRAGRSHPDYIKAAACYAELLNNVGRVHDSLAIENEIRILLESTNSGIYTEAYALCLRQTGELHKQLGAYDQAEAVFMRSLRLARAQQTEVTTDIAHLIQLFTQTGNLQRVLELLVYALMYNDADNNDWDELLTHIDIAPNADTDFSTETITEALVALNDRKKIAPIIKKWRLWEDELFIPSYVAPPQVDRGMM